MDFRMPFGKHKGKRLAIIAQDHLPYVEWVAANVSGDIAEAAKVLIKDIEWRRRVGFAPRRID